MARLEIGLRSRRPVSFASVPLPTIALAIAAATLSSV
jgi:hypothetical protein